MTEPNMWPRNKWSLDHLNWSIILYPLPILFLVYLPLIFIGYFLEIQETQDLGPTITIYTVTCFSLTVIWSYYLYIWNLRHKGRSLWNLLYILIPYIGGIIFLCLSNKVSLAREKLEIEEIDKASEEYFKKL